MFQLQQVSYRVPERELLSDITLDIHPNRVYGLIGHNGSGKSTLLKLLTRQIVPASGSLQLNGRATADHSARELVEMGRYAWRGLLGRRNEDDRTAVAEAFALTHTEHFADQIVDTLSGGERSRIWLAMCLAQQSRFLLLDEPLAALDIAHQLEVMDLVRKLSRQLGLGVVIVIHDINLAARYCDELVALKHGRLLKRGTPADIMTADVLHEIYNVAMHIICHPQHDTPLALP